MIKIFIVIVIGIVSSVTTFAESGPVYNFHFNNYPAGATPIDATKPLEVTPGEKEQNIPSVQILDQKTPNPVDSVSMSRYGLIYEFSSISLPNKNKDYENAFVGSTIGLRIANEGKLKSEINFKLYSGNAEVNTKGSTRDIVDKASSFGLGVGFNILNPISKNGRWHVLYGGDLFILDSIALEVENKTQQRNEITNFGALANGGIEYIKENLSFKTTLSYGICSSDYADKNTKGINEYYKDSSIGAFGIGVGYLF